MTTYHPTAGQALGHLQKLLDNENKEVAGILAELRRRARNRARLEIAMVLLAPDTDDEVTQEEIDAETAEIVKMLGLNHTPSNGNGKKVASGGV